MLRCFDYKCPKCGKTEEVFIDGSKGKEPICEDCNVVMVKIPSAPAFVLKGAGWAKDGYKGSNK